MNRLIASEVTGSMNPQALVRKPILAVNGQAKSPKCSVLHRIPILSRDMTPVRDLGSRRGNFIVIQSENDLELALGYCLEGLGISTLGEWDVLVFVYRHGTILTNADHVARLIGYASALVSSALDRLEREKLIEHSRSFQGVRSYRIAAWSANGERHRCFQELVNLSQSRAGRVLLAKRLCSDRSELSNQTLR